MSETFDAAAWRDRYLKAQTGWERGMLNPFFIGWREAGLLPEGRVVIPGCGRSLEPAALAERGAAVTAIDLVSDTIDWQRAHFDAKGVDGSLEVADILDWAPAQPVDAIYEQTCLCALAPESWEGYAERLHRWLRSGGRLFALFMQTGTEGGPPYDCPIDDMRALFPQSRWRWPDEPYLSAAHPGREGMAEIGVILERR